MCVVFRKSGSLLVTGLLLLWLCSLANETAAQSFPRSGGRTAMSYPGAFPAAYRPAGYASKSARLVKQSSGDGEVEIVDGGTYYEDASGNLVPGTGPLGGPTAGPAVSSSARPIIGHAEEFMDEPCCDDGSCGECALEPCCGLPLLPLDNLELFAGVQGFTGPTNRGGTGSFGFYEGLNWAAPFPIFQSCLGMQFGSRVTHSNLSGAEFTPDTRTQVFVTGGLFRRVDFGLQGGVVIDHLNDSWYRSASLTNLRAELSWVFDGQDDLGFWFTHNTRNSVDRVSRLVINGNASNQTQTWTGTDLYAFFYRRQFGECRDGEARIFGGFTGQSDAVLGLDGRLPLTDTWSLQAGFTYLVPKQGSGTALNAAYAQESWNLGLGLVWVPGRAWANPNSRYYRPLFNVADNGNFMLDHN